MSTPNFVSTVSSVSRRTGWRAAALTVITTALAGAVVAQAIDTRPYALLGGLGGAFIQRVAVDAQDTTALYVDVSGGRIARSFNGGVRWDIVQVGKRNEYFRAIQVHPLDSNVVFAFSASDDGLSAGRFYISSDRGAHWTQTAAQPIGDFGQAGDGRGLATDARGRIIVVADLFEGVFRSVDFGSTWTNTLSGSQATLYGVITDPNDTRTLWTIGNDSNGASAAWVSRDFGLTWTESLIAPFDPMHFTVPTEAAVQPGTGNIVVGLNNFDLPDFSSRGLIARSTDRGQSWSISDPGVAEWNAGRTIVFDPTAPATVLAGNNGGPGALRSTDGGESWSQVGPQGGLGVLTLTAWPAGSRASGHVVGSNQELFTSDDFGATWSGSNPFLAAAGAFRIVDDPRIPNGLYGLSGTGELGRSIDGGAHWTDIAPRGVRNVGAMAVDTLSRTHPLFVATSTDKYHNSAWRSLDGGLHWTQLMQFPSDTQVLTLLTDPAKPGQVYAFGTQGTAIVLMRSVDFGEHWTSSPIGSPGDFPAPFAVPIVSDPSRSGTLYAALFFSGLWKTADGGVTWNQISSLPLEDFGVVGLATTPGPNGGVFVVTAGYDGSFTLQKSTDGGVSWNIATSPPFQLPYQLASGPDGRLFAYATAFPFGCFDNEVQMSRDSGQTWSGVSADAVLTQMTLGHCAAVMPTASHLFLSDFTGNQLIYGARYSDIDAASAPTGLPSEPHAPLIGTARMRPQHWTHRDVERLPP